MLFNLRTPVARNLTTRDVVRIDEKIAECSTIPPSRGTSWIA